jgi:ferrous-iron efflux pump FieF
LTETNTIHAQLLRNATRASVAVAGTLIVIKIIAYVMTGSVALLSSLIDSILDAFASTINLFAVRHALSPADAEHRFGHGKAEPLAGLGQAAFIIVSSIFLIFEALNHLINPRQIDNGLTGIIVIVVSLLLTIALVRYQKYVVQRTNSLAVAADSIHYVSDVVMNLSVIAALVCSAWLDWPAADPLFALAIAAYIIYSAWTIVTNAFNQLMDRELPDSDRERIAAIARRHAEVRNLHELRTRASGKDIFIQLHLEMNGEISLNTAHRIADEVEREIKDAFPGADVLIHQDPYDDESNKREG